MSDLTIDLTLLKTHCRISGTKFDDNLRHLVQVGFLLVANVLDRTIYATQEDQAAANDGNGDPDGIVVNKDIEQAVMDYVDFAFYKKEIAQSSEKKLPNYIYNLIRSYRKMGV